ncbi:hypothetical protein B0H12DRAFT_1155637 [Mycena haematopus]|nr:hypothetical protein B0H12DRAFT_1155637 [Mycena haematopus]
MEDPLSPWNSRVLCPNCSFLRFNASHEVLPPLPHHLTTTNDPPSAVDAAEVRDVVGAVQSCLGNPDVIV